MQLEKTLNYIPQFIKNSSEIYEELQKSIQWRRDEITLYGKKHAIPRYHAWYGDPGAQYSYSGIQLPRHDWTPTLTAIKKQIEEQSGISFNSVLLNFYRDGNDSNGWHADNEKELIRPIHVASISIGAARDMQFRRVGETKTLEKIYLENGSLLVMKSPCQENFQHQIPKRKTLSQGRINLTFRLVRIDK